MDLIVRNAYPTAANARPYPRRKPPVSPMLMAPYSNQVEMYFISGIIPGISLTVENKSYEKIHRIYGNNNVIADVYSK